LDKAFNSICLVIIIVNQGNSDINIAIRNCENLGRYELPMVMGHGVNRLGIRYVGILNSNNVHLEDLT